MPRLQSGVPRRLKCSFTLKPRTYQLLQEGAVIAETSIGKYAETLIQEAWQARMAEVLDKDEQPASADDALSRMHQHKLVQQSKRKVKR